MNTYKIRILAEDGQTEVRSLRRKGLHSPDSLKKSLREQNDSWLGVLAENSDLDCGLDGGHQLPGGSYVLILRESGKFLLAVDFAFGLVSRVRTHLSLLLRSWTGSSSISLYETCLLAEVSLLEN